MNLLKTARFLASSTVFALGLTSAASAQVGTVSWLNNGSALSASLHGLDNNQLDVFLAWCQPEKPNTIYAEFYGELSNLPMDEASVVRIQGASGVTDVRAQKTTRRRGPGMFMETSAGDPVWKILAGSGHVVMSANGAVLAVLSNVDTNAASAFLTDCTPAGNAAVVQQRPVQRAKNTQVQVTQPTRHNAAADNGGSLFVQGIAVGAGLVGAAIIANEVADTFFTEAPSPSANAVGEAGVLSVDIVSVRANDTTFGFGGDEVFLLFSNGARFPNNPGAYQDINNGEVWSPSAQVDGFGALSVDLREWDSIGASDLIGNISINASQGAGRFTQTLTGDGANYEVTYDVRVAQGRTQSGQAGVPPSAQGRNRVWSNGGSYETITALDCRDDCEEDIGIIIICEGLGLPASVGVPWLSTEQGPAGRSGPITLNVDGQIFQYSARVGNYGLVGHIPDFMINPHDPLVDALQAGSNVRIAFDGAEADIGLKGSRSSLEIFKAHCGWNNVPIGAQVSNGQSGEADPVWYAGRYSDGSGRLIRSLTYGVPETDAIGFSALCVPGSGRIEAVLSVNFGNLQNGASTSAYVQASGQTFQYQGQVIIQSEESAGVLIRTNPGDPMWTALSQAQPSAVFGMIGGGQLLGSSRGAAAAIAQFLPACQSVVASPQTNAQATYQPQVQQPVGQNIPSQGTTNQAATAPSASFLCDDGTSMRITFSQTGGGKTANVSRNGGAGFSLNGAPAPFGERYTDGVANMTINSGNLLFSAPNISISCRAN